MTEKNRSLRIFHLSPLELLLFIYAGCYPFVLRSYIPEIDQQEIGRVVSSLIMISLATGLIIGFTRIRLGVNDFRTKMTAHVLVFAIATVFMLNGLSTVIGFTESLATTGFIEQSRFEEILMIGRLTALPVIVIHALVMFSELYSISDLYIEEIDNVTNAYLDGDLNVRVDDPEVMTDSTFGKIGDFFNEVITSINTLVNEIGGSSQVISSTSETLLSGAEEVNASAEEVSSTSQSMSMAASQQAEMIAQSVEDISQTENVVDDIIDQIQSNSGIISQIALQTNILALNAGIEASRAGDYGRGFAVVAENVRRLSEESKNAAEEITQVATSVSDTLRNAFMQIRLQIEEVASLSQETAASAEEVAAASEETTSAMEEVSNAANYLSEKALQSNEFVQQYIKK